ncbi:MAG: phosphate transport system permease protein [Pirellulaceae bacterium]|nr:MAG: phosphate transport system permease protein [Pirellulaceae bacterium]
MIWWKRSSSSLLSVRGCRRFVDRLLGGAGLLSALLGASLVIWMLGFVLVESWPALQQIGPLRFLTDTAWYPTLGRFGMWPMVVATVVVTIGSVVVTTPVALGSAVYLRFYAPPVLAGLYRRVLWVLAGVPSVVYGWWGITALVPMIGRFSPFGFGHSLLAGVLVLSIMTLPLAALTVDTALGAVPRDYLAAAAALGLGRRAVAWQVAVPLAWRGVLAGVLLQTARAIGETMAVLMVCGNVVQLPVSLFAPVRLLTANIALEMGYATQLHRSALFVSGLWLLVLAAVLVWAAQRLERECT